MMTNKMNRADVLTKKNRDSRCADKQTNKINSADMLPIKVKETNSDVEMTDNGKSTKVHS